MMGEEEILKVIRTVKNAFKNKNPKIIGLIIGLKNFEEFEKVAEELIETLDALGFEIDNKIVIPEDNLIEVASKKHKCVLKFYIYPE